MHSAVAGDSCPNKKDNGWKAIRPTLVTDLQFFQRPRLTPDVRVSGTREKERKKFKDYYGKLLGGGYAADMQFVTNFTRI